MHKKTLEPSLLAFDTNKIPAQLDEIKKLDIEIIHYDVMDGYVNNTSFGTEWLQTIIDKGFKINVHLMVFDPLKLIKDFAKFALNTLTFQFEAVDHATSLACLNEIKRHHIKAGIAIKPATPFSVYEPLLKTVEIVTVMTVEPGKGGQSFMPSAMTNLINLYEYRQQNNLNYIIEVDGGIKLENVQAVLKHADYIISGTGFMKLDTPERNHFIKVVKG